MNFLSHFFLDRQIDDSLFVVGACTPDLLSIFDRKIKFKERDVSKRVLNSQLSAEQQSFYQGVIRHFEVDKLFHSSDFFHSETQRLGKDLREAFPNQEIKRSFFVAHILLELGLDRLLIQEDERYLATFYRHFEQCKPRHIRELSTWLAGEPITPSYDTFLRKFTRDKHMYRYQDWDYIIYVLKRIMRRVGIFDYKYLDSTAFLRFLHQYELELATRYQQALSVFTQQLSV